MKRRILAVFLFLLIFALAGCTSEQTIVRKVNEPMALEDTEQLRAVDAPWGDGSLIAMAPDGLTALVRGDGQTAVWRGGKLSPLVLPFELSDGEACWSPNSRYVCLMTSDGAAVADTDRLKTQSVGVIQTACFNADQVTLYYIRQTGSGSTLCRVRVFEGEEEQLLTVDEALRGPMFRTTRSQYLVMGDNKLLCLEQDEKGTEWKKRVVADFAPSGMIIRDFSYSAQTGLCIVSGDTAEGYTVFSVVSPDGKDFAIDRVSCFSPVGENPAVNLPASELSALSDPAAYPVRLSRVQLSPGGLYLMLWGQDVTGGGQTMHLLNLDSGKLTDVEMDPALSGREWADVRWCAGKTFVLRAESGETALAAVTGWDD